MGTMAVVGLAFALWTQQIRRQRDYQSSAADAGPPPVVAVPPAKLPALGYLPRDTDVLIGVHVAEIRQLPLGQAVLARLTLGSGDFGLGGLEQATGLQPEEVDHVVLGLKIDERLLPRVILVVQTRQPYDPEKVLAALKAGRRTERGSKTLYRFALNQPPVDAAVWCADKQTVIFGLTPEDLDDVPLTPQIDLERFPLALRPLLTEEAPERTRAWLIGHADRWDKTAAQLLWLAMTKEAQEALARIHTIGFWLLVDTDLAIRGTLKCRDEPAAGVMNGYLNRYLGKPEELRRLFRVGAESEAFHREVVRTLRCNQEKNQVWISAKPDREFLDRTFRPTEHAENPR